MTKKEAVREWAKNINSIPQSLIVKAYPDMEEIEILATKRVCSECGGTNFREEAIDEDETGLICEYCNAIDSWCESYELPMWGTMWTFDNSCDEDWAKENIETMRNCGFWVYESDELGIFFGIDGAGYDFYEDHWIPLYEARGLKWHERELV